MDANENRPHPFLNRDMRRIMELEADEREILEQIREQLEAESEDNNN